MSRESIASLSFFEWALKSCLDVAACLSLEQVLLFGYLEILFTEL